MEEDHGYVDNSCIRAGDSQSSGLNITMRVGPGARVFAPILSNVQARDVTFSQNDGGASLSGGETDITSVITKYKKSLVAEHERIREYTSRPGEHVLLADRYVDPLIIQRHKEKKEKKKEIRSKGKDFHHARTYHTDHHITVDKLFSQEDSPNNVRPKAVILQGNSGSGKSFTAQKILYDWAIGNLFAGIFDVVFYLLCSDLNDIPEDISLVELLNCSEEMAQIVKKMPERVLFLVDGFDELRLSLPKKPLPVKADIKAGPGAVLSSLLRGCMLNESFLLVTTRSVAAEKLGKLLKHPQRFTEIMGFSENGIQQYFQMFFKHDERSRQVYDQVKANGTLYTACSSPVMCWLVCSVFKEKSKMSKKMTRGFRSTTSIFVDFVFILLEHHCQDLIESHQRDLLKDLGQLAHEGILKGRVLFQRNQVPETILHVLDSTRIPFLCTFHYKDRINVKEMFSFMHLSFQEFFAALLYTFLDETEAELKLEKLLSASLQGGYHCLPIVQFLFGLSNKAVKSLLMEKHQQAVSCTTCAQLKEWLYKFVSRKLNMQLSCFTLQCLCEVNDKCIVEKAMKIWEANGVEIQLSSSDMTDYHAAAQCLQFCRRIKSLKLQGSTMENLKMLHTTLSKCDKLHLSVSYVSDNDVADLISAVGKGKDLQCLSVEDGDLSDQSVEGIMSALHKRRSVNSVHLSVKTINYTNAEIFMNLVESDVVSNNLSVATKCRNSEENICSDLELSGPDMFHRIYVYHPSLNTYDLHIDSGKSGQTFKSICLSHGGFNRVMSPSEWRKFLQISSNLKQIGNHEFHGHMEELVSFLKSGPESWPTVQLDAKSLSQKCAAKILSFCHAAPALNSGFHSCWFNVESLKGMDEEDVCSPSLQTHCSISVVEGVLCLDFKAHAWSPHTTQSVESTPVLREISLRFPVISEGAHVDWEDLLRRLCQMRKSLERCPLFCVLRSVPGLMEVTLRLSSLLENWAVVLSFFQECTSLQYFQVKVENKSENLEIVRGDTLRNTESVFLRKKAVLSLGCSHLYYSSKMHSEMLDLQYTLGSHEVVPCIILILTDNTEIYNIDWRQFFNFYHQLKGLTEHCLEYDQSMDALLSVVKSVPGLKGMNLALRFLTVDGAFSIVQLMQTCPSLHKIDVTVPGQQSNFTNSRESDRETNSISSDHSDSSESTDSSESDSETNSISSDHSDTCRSTNSISEEIENYELDLCSELTVRKNTRNKFKLSLRCNSSDPDTKAVLAYVSLILTEYTEESEIDWRCFFQSYYDSKGSTERSTDFDGKVKNIMRFLHDVPGLEEVEMGVHSLTETWASCILHLCHANNSIDNICLLLEKEKDMESACSSFTIRRNHKDSTVTVEIQRVKHTETSPSLISFKVPDSEICNINGHDLLHRMRCLKCINDKPLEYEEGINKLMSLLHGIPGLQQLDLEIGILTQSWATQILSFSTCSSLKKICVKGHMLMEDAILTIQNDWKRDCVVVLKGLLLEKEKDMESACLSCTIKRNLTDSTVTVEIQRVKHTKTSPSLISFKVPDSEICNIIGHNLLHRMRCPKCINDKSYNYEEEMNKLMSFLHGIPGLQKLKLKIGNVTRSWATRILSFSTCPSLNKICVKGHMLMEDAILKIKKKWKRRDCVVVLKGLRCSNSTDRCTEENWSPESFQFCNKKVKLSQYRGCFSELDESYSESEIDIYNEVFEGYEDIREPEWDDEEM